MAREPILRSAYYSGLFLFFVVLLVIFFLFCTFGRVGLFSFYVFFESSLIPTVFIILGWGYQPERLQAGIYLLFYTLLASLPMLVGIAAPTPVSALVHSSTLVTAGVYLLIRFRPAFGDWLCIFLLVVSGLTMFIAGLGANFEYDLRKIIALSTLRQLGLIISAVSVGLVSVAFFHLLTHALFKALLFMCAGVIIHTIKDSQDIRFMGNLSVQIPFTSVCLGVSSFALCGMPFLAGFYSKDLILEAASFRYINLVGFLLFFVSTGLTVCYSFRLFYYVFVVILICLLSIMLVMLVL
ncbi:hypothetical protein B7P43_G17888 [Cryptotermes secundus]|uniref:NADH:ubiquinone reductase (H(+)-translocating) n=1 Tax=Cryptotermes secundus TaxID=105785 RepID=A0A2J7R947_9NEOP|nr:hypothetical protein B7P43_G17888 [Cryptotermes secundus]